MIIIIIIMMIIVILIRMIRIVSRSLEGFCPQSPPLLLGGGVRAGRPEARGRAIYIYIYIYIYMYNAHSSRARLSGHNISGRA